MSKKTTAALFFALFLTACSNKIANDDAAYQMHMEDEIGSIEVGKKADLVVLDQNIFEVDAYDIHKTQVVLTMMDGDIVYEATDP